MVLKCMAETISAEVLTLRSNIFKHLHKKYSCGKKFTYRDMNVMTILGFQ